MAEDEQVPSMQFSRKSQDSKRGSVELVQNTEMSTRRGSETMRRASQDSKRGSVELVQSTELPTWDSKRGGDEIAEAPNIRKNQDSKRGSVDKKGSELQNTEKTQASHKGGDSNGDTVQVTQVPTTLDARRNSQDKKEVVASTDIKGGNVEIVKHPDRQNMEVSLKTQDSKKEVISTTGKVGKVEIVQVTERTEVHINVGQPSPSATLPVRDSVNVALCYQCKEIYDDPRLLSCLHSFCRKCLPSLTTQVGSTAVLCCPKCRSITPIPSDGLDSIQVNLYLEHESTIERFVAKMTGESKPRCEECSRDPARETVSFCCTCISFLCELCHAQHVVSRKSHLHHKVLVIDEGGGANIRAKLRQFLTFLPTTCPIHVRQEIAFFCKECEVLLCVQCALTKHPGHRVEDLFDFVRRQKNAFSEDVKDLPNMVYKLDDLMSNGRMVCDGIRSREVSIRDSIDKVFAELHHALDMRKATLLQQCTEIAATKTDSLTGQVEDLSLLREAILTCDDFVATSRELYDESEFISVLGTLHKRIVSIKAKVKSTPMDLSEDDVIHFNSDTTAVLNCIGTMGSVYVLRQQDYSSLHDPITTIKTTNAYHVAVHRSGDYIVANHVGDCMELYNSSGSKKLVIGRNGNRPGQFRRPLGVAIVGDIFYVVEYTGNRCQKMTMKGEFLCEIGAGQVAGGWGCAVSKNGVLYVAEETNNRVQAFTPDGKTLKILCSSPTIYAPRDVAIDRQGKIHVAACGSKCIKVFDQNGSFLREYGSGLVTEPSGVAVDHLNFCFVADWAGKSLHVFDPSGTRVNKVEFDGCISGVSIDNNNHVHVVNHTTQTVSMF